MLPKGPEIDLVKHGQQRYFDKDCHGRPQCAGGLVERPRHHTSRTGGHGLELHYWREGRPQRGVDFTERTACVDFSAINSGALVAYRWSGECELREANYANVVG